MVIRKRPKDTKNLCLDKGYDFPEIENESIGPEDIHRTYVIEEKQEEWQGMSIE